MDNSFFEKLTNKVWVKKNGNDYLFKNRTFLSAKKGGYKFYEDGRVFIRINVNQCFLSGPSYINLMGKWKQLSDSTFSIEYKLWDIKNKEVYKIKSQTKNKIELMLIRKYDSTMPKPKPFLD